MIERAEASDPRLLALLRNHPRVSAVQEGRTPGLSFQQGPWSRSIFEGDAALEVSGLVELMDNNPLVCADAASVPDPASTLALIALGPLIRAGLLHERPTLMINVEADETQVDAFLAREGWREGATVSSESLDFGSVVAATVMAEVRTPKRLEDLDDLYEECYGRSFFVRRDEMADWDVSLVQGKPHALYRMRIAVEDPVSLLTIQVMADRDGKCGAAQIVHCMNVMAGFEETFGIA